MKHVPFLCGSCQVEFHLDEFLAAAGNVLQVSQEANDWIIFAVTRDSHLLSVPPVRVILS